jgi:hypothetical protein
LVAEIGLLRKASSRNVMMIRERMFAKFIASGS